MFQPDSPIETVDDGCRIHVHVRPSARKDEPRGLHGGRLKVHVKAPPVDGAANQAVIALLADLLEVAAHQITLTGGASSRRKSFHVEGLDAPTARRRLHL